MRIPKIHFAKTCREFCIYLVFLLVTTIITMSSREIGMYYFNHTIGRLFLHRATINKHSMWLTYEDLLTVDDWWAFVKSTFIQSIAQFDLSSLEHKFAVGGNVLLGLPRLRQIRVANETCEVDKVFQNKFPTCYGPYWKSKEDIGGFLKKKHVAQSEISTYTVYGSVAHYHGGGYMELLTFDLKQNEEILSKLKDAFWVDEATRLILIEFALFNVNVKLFCNAKLLAEIPATGGVITSSQLQSVKYSPLWNDGEFFVLFCSVIFCGLILYSTFVTIRGIITIGCVSFFCSLFNILDIVILLIAYLSVAYVVWHTFHLRSILEKYEENANQFFSLDVICFWNLFFIDMMGISAFIVWLQVLKYVKFNKTMKQFSTTLERCAKDLFGFTIMFLIVFIAYAYLAVLLFGAVHSDFCDFGTAILTLMRAALGDFDYEKLEEANRILGPIFFLSFILLVFFILMNMFLAIINDTYSDVKSEINNENGKPLSEYIKSFILKLKGFIITANVKDNDKDSEKQEEDEAKDISPTPQTRRSVQGNNRKTDQKPRTKKEIIDSFFEIISIDRDGFEDGLTERVTLLEKKMVKLVDHLDEILEGINESAAKPSSKSL